MKVTDEKRMIVLMPAFDEVKCNEIMDAILGVFTDYRVTFIKETGRNHTDIVIVP